MNHSSYNVNAYLVRTTGAMEERWDPEIKKYFRKVLYSITYGLMWLMACATFGIYFQLAYTNGKPFVFTALYYAGVIITMGLLIRWYYLTWRK